MKITKTLAREQPDEVVNEICYNINRKYNHDPVDPDLVRMVIANLFRSARAEVPTEWASLTPVITDLANKHGTRHQATPHNIDSYYTFTVKEIHAFAHELLSTADYLKDKE